MKYIINLTITFDPDNRVLMLRNNDQITIGLSKPATRLLNELIKNNKNELTRETLIKHVWEDYGFSPSSATLSNHISELRKSFEALGGSKDILITVPRVGFKLEAEIHPETKLPKEDTSVEMIVPAVAASELVMQDNVTPNFTDSGHKTTLRRMLKPSLALALGLFAIAVAIKLITLNRDEEPMLVGVQDKCEIYTPGDNKKNNEQSVRARKMLYDEKIDCTQENHDIYYIEARPANDSLKINFMAVCTQSADMNYKNCNNYKLVE
ncbi:TPA: winged helix-turn-helix domain-containing protein [Serratia marcescens]|uniref:transcriptional regulator n=1 Tax=Serratia marcescens TaxID=615 RepID=UPI0018D8F985|nr:winged helix-turn-helix domain-containing protein [Serratia marcescens]MBH2769066.1 winged helix-turn-helix domain-containing protein [Serratia marcescens]MDK1710450.1 winged helix-turn-helix domain-containing protein [Serratia marcescens]